MAGKTTTKKTTSSTSKTKKSPAAQRISSEAVARNKQRRNMWSILLFALGLLTVGFSLMGDSFAENPSAWDLIHSFLSGIFGVTVFFVGPMIIYVAIMISADKGRSTISVKLLQLVLFILLFSAAMQVIFVGTIGEEGSSFFEAIGYVYEQGRSLNGGGVCGMLLGSILLLFGRIGGSIIIILITFVVIMLIANVTLLDFLKLIAKPFKALFGYAKVKKDEYQEEKEYTRLEYEREREEKLKQKELEKTAKVSGSDNEERFKDIARVVSDARGGSNNAAKTMAENKPVPAAKNAGEKLREQARAFIGEPVETEPEVTSASIAPAIKNVDETVDNGSDNGIIEGVNPDEIAVINIDDDPAPWEDVTLVPINKNDENSESVEDDKKDENPIISALEDYENELNKKQEENRQRLLQSTTEPQAVNENNSSEVSAETGVVDKNNEAKKSFEEIISEAEQYVLPPVDLLNDVVKQETPETVQSEINDKAERLVATLKSFGVSTSFLEAIRGPSVTRYELAPAPGVKISKITNLVDDISLSLATAGVRIEAPIPNKAAVGIEVPNKIKETVSIREMIDSDTFRDCKGKLGAALGKNISGDVVIANIAEMPHILIAGTTGSGKSVCVNSIIMSILFRSTPDEVRLLMIDPKAVEFMIYNGIPHLLIPVVTDPKKAAGALAWAVTEMDKRYKALSENGVRDIYSYNKLADKNPELEKMSQIVIFIDELADLMMTSKNDVEDSICRIAQKARAAGMHLVVATQRPSVDVVTGLIKSNIPSRIALKVASQVDSRTIIDSAGAEKLLGKGDMLFLPVGMPKPMRVQGCWVSDSEVERVTTFIKNSFILDYDTNVMDQVERQAELVGANDKTKRADSGDIDVSDEKLYDAIDAVMDAGVASTSQLQRRLQVGYGRAAKLIDVMEKMAIVGPAEGTKPRQLLISKQEWYEMKLNQKNN